MALTNTTDYQTGMIVALTAVKQTLEKYAKRGLTTEEVEDMIEELDQQIAVRQVTIQLDKPSK